jgi:hypothetical protein
MIGLLASAAASGRDDGNPTGTFRGCPVGLEPLPTDATRWQPGARAAAHVFLTTTFARWNRQRHWRMKLAGAQERMLLPVRKWIPSGWVKRECGRTVWDRSVMVDFDLPAMGPCESCAHVVFLLGKTRRGWITWGEG